ncbi:hypothetical protein H8B15_09050 [Hymenobacter sp. BT507]|uniref:DUF4251 domain-containing protein n=1 Tax=Hymenobacter citatus TaxID=2763506 RepID=A0ABR7MJM5_9BACT|nr:hypothetical protein [Hymenobacter citatus]MBC6611069.1 hypothetical protein [Hymenobacter citatus]
MMLTFLVPLLLLQNAEMMQPMTPTEPVPQEYIAFEQVKINGRLPLKSKRTQLFKELGQPDSLAKPNIDDVCVSFYDKPFSYAYFKGSQVELYGDLAMVGNLEFAGNSRLTLTTPTITLSNKTTLAELAKRFPKAVAAKSEMNVHRKGKYMTVHIATDKATAEDYWILFFRNGRLARIDYWMPC